MSCLGNTLHRVARDQWVWSDGTPEPRVEDLSPCAHYNFRCRTDANGTYVEVPLSAAHNERDVLGWVLEGIDAGKYAQGHSGDHTGPLMMTDAGLTRMRIEPGEDPLLGHEPIIHRRAIPRVALVPVAEWDAWADEHPYGAVWDKEHEADILAKARALGWQSGKPAPPPLTPTSLLPLDVGFDVRVQGMFVRLESLYVTYQEPDGTVTQVCGDPVTVAETLARNGYSVVAFRTANGRDVQCTPTDLAPVGDGECGNRITWAVQPPRDNYWSRGPHLEACLAQAGWTLDDLTPVAEAD